MLGHEEVVKAEPLGENSLAYLAHEHALVALMDLGHAAVGDRDRAGCGDRLEIARTVVKYP